MHVDAARNFLEALLGGAALVVGLNARRRIGVERIAVHVGRMAVHHLARRVRGLDLFERLLIPRDDARVVHHLAEAVKERPLDLAGGLRAVENGAARLKGRGGNAGRQLQIDVERLNALLADARERLLHILRPRDARDVDELVRVGDDARRAVRDRELREGLGGEQRALHMDVPVHQPGKDEESLRIVDGAPFIPLPDGGDLPVLDGDVGFFELARKHIENTCAPYNEVAFFALHGAIDELFHSPIIAQKRPHFKPLFIVLSFTAGGISCAPASR